MHDGGNTTPRILAKMLRELLDHEEYIMLADVIADLKARAAKARIRWTPDDISAALSMVGSNRELVRNTLPKTLSPAPELVPETPIVSRELAADIVRELRQRHDPNAPRKRGERLMRFWLVTRNRVTCGRCRRTIPAGAVALKLTFQKAPRTALWRCTDCVGPPPPDVVAEAEAAAVVGTDAPLIERLAALVRRSLPDWKMRQTGDRDDAE